MKKRLILSFIVATTTIFSQENTQENATESKMSVGIEGGFSLNKFRASGSDVIGMNFSNKASFVTGVNFSYNVLSYLNIKASLNYENKGSKVVFPGFFGAGAEIRYNFNYINLPIVVSYQHNISKLILHAGLGPNFSILLGANVESTFGGSQTITEDCSRFDLGIAGEAGVSYPLLSKFLIDLSFREIFGLLNVISDPTTDAVLRTNSMSLVLGIKYKL